MLSFKKFKTRAMGKLRLGRTWLMGKLRRKPKEPTFVISHPTDFRRENITLGIDVEGNAMIVEQAREDAQLMFYASKNQAIQKSVH